MTDLEINQAVAKKIGDWSGCAETLPDYCNSIKAAWEIVEKERMHVIPVNNGQWYANTGEIDRNGSDEWYWGRNAFDEEYKDFIADTAPMAICLAFLKLP